VTATFFLNEIWAEAENDDLVMHICQLFVG